MEQRQERIKIFMDKVYPEPNTNCWLWSGGTSKSGHGKFNYKGGQLAHRFSYLIFTGPIGHNHVLHKCDVACCVNPEHLYLGDTRQNNIDRDTRGRQRTKRGIDHKLAKLTDADVLEIRRLHDPKTYPSRKLAKMFGVCQRKIMHILHRESWNHI